MKAQAKLLFCIIAYASSECPDEPAHSPSIITAFTARIEKRTDVDEGLYCIAHEP